MDINAQSLKIAVVGSGAAGLVAAYLLQRKHDVTVFEKNDYVGGHTHTIVIEGGDDAGTPVDTGFIVMNHRNYPLLTRLLEELGVPLRDSDMSFGYHDERTGLQYCGSGLNGLFAQRLNLLRPSFLRMIRDLLRFYKSAPADLEAGSLAGLPLGRYLERGGYSALFIEEHIVPMGAAIWSTPVGRMMEFPAEDFVHFFRNHGLLTLSDRPQWRTVVGGSHQYVKAILRTLKRPVRVGTPVARVARQRDRVLVYPETGDEEAFDRVVIAAHADEALTMLADPSDDERRLLGPWKYAENRTVLHTDASVLPPNRRAWASWNFVRDSASDGTERASVTYDMNRLQGLRTRERYLVSLNRLRPIDGPRTIRDLLYTHPTYTFASIGTQRGLAEANGARNTYFCGAYFGYGFHEDAVRSGVDVARAFGIEFGG